MNMHESITVDNSQELTQLKNQMTELKMEIQEIKGQQESTYKMIENIATSQNDLETNVYKAIMKIYNKIEDINKNNTSSAASARKRDASPISFQHRSNLP
jgi:uncharacterized coiled-coil DUF342 family protein